MDRYMKVVFTVIALALVGVTLQLLWHTVSPSEAQAARHEPLAVYLAQISDDAAECLASRFWLSSGDNGPCIAGRY